MPRRSAKHCGGGTSPAQQRINRARSVATLSRLLELNFPGGARLIVLSYDPDGYIPAGAYAEPDIVDWLRWVSRQLGGVFQYVRATAQEPTTVHRVITAIQRTDAEDLAAHWEYGPASVEEIADEQFPVLAEQIAGKAGAYRHSWIASKGLKRPQT